MSSDQPLPVESDFHFPFLIGEDSDRCPFAAVAGNIASDGASLWIEVHHCPVSMGLAIQEGRLTFFLRQEDKLIYEFQP